MKNFQKKNNADYGSCRLSAPELVFCLFLFIIFTIISSHWHAAWCLIFYILYYLDFVCAILSHANDKQVIWKFVRSFFYLALFVIVELALLLQNVAYIQRHSVFHHSNENSLCTFWFQFKTESIHNNNNNNTYINGLDSKQKRS